MQVGLATSVKDQSDRHSPIVLHVDPALANGHKIRLQTLIHSWHNHVGMQTALTRYTPLFCLQIDRHVQLGTRESVKSDTQIGAHGGCTVPMFRDATLDIHWVDYIGLSQL